MLNIENWVKKIQSWGLGGYELNFAINFLARNQLEVYIFKLLKWLENASIVN